VGRAVEHVGDGCCNPIIDLTMRVRDPRRSGTGWVATTTLVSVDVHPGWKDSGRPAPRAGNHGTLTLENGLLTDSVTSVTYCNRTQAEKGACGA
jgi:hypothetical protein